MHLNFKMKKYQQRMIFYAKIPVLQILMWLEESKDFEAVLRAVCLSDKVSCRSYTLALGQTINFLRLPTRIIKTL